MRPGGRPQVIFDEDGDRIAVQDTYEFKESILRLRRLLRDGKWHSGPSLRRAGNIPQRNFDLLTEWLMDEVEVKYGDIRRYRLRSLRAQPEMTRDSGNSALYAKAENRRKILPFATEIFGKNVIQML